MSDYTRIVMEADTRGRLNICALDDEGGGHGHRLAGPRYIEGGGDQVVNRTLDERDIDALREYADIFALFTLTDEPAELFALSQALRWYLRTRERVSGRFGSQHAHLPHHVERREKTRVDLVKACRALADVLDGVR